jgi:hypothetical protein
MFASAAIDAIDSPRALILPICATRSACHSSTPANPVRATRNVAMSSTRPGPVAPVPHSPGLELPAPSSAPGFSTGYSPWPHPTTRLTRPTTTANFTPHQSSSSPSPIAFPTSHSHSAHLHRRPQPSSNNNSHHHPPPPLSRPVEDCVGLTPALAGVRNLGLDGPTRGRPD